MAENSVVRAPYNFVPFSKKVLEYNRDMLPDHDQIDPTLKTGRIYVTLTADTPVFVSDGNMAEPHFFRNSNGCFALPGSTIRGMVRANMQILGFGVIRPGEDLEDRRIFFRNIADGRKNTGGELKKYYHSALAVKAIEGPSGKTYSIPQNVRAGYLRKIGDKYQIQPVQGSWIKVSKRTLDSVGMGDLHAKYIPVYYTAAEGYAKKVQVTNGPLPEGMKPGVLLCPGVDTRGDGTRIDQRTGQPKHPSHRYIFPEKDQSANLVEIKDEDVISYAADWESRKNTLAGGTQIKGKKVIYDPDFWKLPDSGEEKPVFYVQHEGHTYFGMSLFLRIGYRFPLKDGLPQRHKDAAAQPGFLDYPHALLGYAEKENAYRSRVSFGDFQAQGDPKELPLVQTILGSPKISYYPGYVVDGHHYNQAAENNTEQAGFQLRGHKLYWLKNAEAKPAPADKPKMVSRMHPLPEGTAFSGIIRYKNLRPEELGLLLWSLRLDDGCYQSVGMGKPYGYGRMKLTIDSLREFDFKTLYSPAGLCSGAHEAEKDAVEQYIKTYDKFAAQALYPKKPKKQPSLRSMPEIQAFFYMRSTIRDAAEVSYMDLTEYKKVRSPLPDVAEFRKVEAERAELTAEKTAAEYSLEALKQRFRPL